MTKPSFIVISIDTLRADEVGCINPISNLTPNLDRFAKRGMTYRKCFAQGPDTRASFCSIMASTYPLMFEDNYIKKGIISRISFVEILKRHGYSTAAFHSNPMLSKAFGYSKGFDIFYDGMERRSFIRTLGFKIIRRLDPQVQEEIQFYHVKLREFLAKNGIPFNYKPYIDAEATLALGKNYLKKIKADYFLWLHLMDVHAPYPKQTIELRVKLNKQNRGKYKFTEEEFKTLKDMRLDRIRYVDEKIGEFLEGVDADTAVFIMSDHGEELLDHGGYGHKYKLYDELIHVPLITNIGKGVSNKLCENLDFPVTILNHAGIAPPKIFMGKLLNKGKEEIFSETIKPTKGQRMLCVRTPKWKLIYSTPGPEFELYDLEVDNKESNNIANLKSEIVTNLAEKIHLHEARKKNIERKMPLYKIKMRAKRNTQHSESMVRK